MYTWKEILNADRSVTPPLNGPEAQYGIQFMLVLALALPLPISISFISNSL